MHQTKNKTEAMMYQRNIRQHGDALTLLRSLPDPCTPLIFFDPQHRDNLDYLKYGNEGARQRGRSKLPQMSGEYVVACGHELARLLFPTGHLLWWMNAYQIGKCLHGRIEGIINTLQCVDLIAWDNEHPGNGYRARRRGDYLVVFQKKPTRAKGVWSRSPSIPDRWVERIVHPRSQHPHIKPIGLISYLIEVLTKPGDLVVDPAAGSFVVMQAARELRRDFIGCDLAMPAPVVSARPATSASVALLTFS
jgi:site-specific DNA-methyltransferase (adenine-specific)